MSMLARAVMITWGRNRDYAARLVGDLSDAQMTAQPVAGVTMNHPAWILAHLTVYNPIAAAMLRGTPFEDPIDHRYGQKSKVVNDPREYPAREALIAEYLRTHDDVREALEAAGDVALAAETPLTRWREKHPRVGDMIVTLLVKHESGHLGQLSAWRRAMGLPGVAM
ncbi:MAG TPA: DinB family protein [Phycisphaerales bacterium]|nr:DinB family protein [Phycisphaerales bacterium]